MRTIRLAALILTVFLSAQAFGQVRVQIPPPTQLTELAPSLIEEKLAQLDGIEGLDEAARAEIRDTLTKALEQARRAEANAEVAAQFRQSVDSSPQRLESIRQELANPPKEPSLELPQDATLQQVEQALTQATSELASARQVLTDLQAEPSQRVERRASIPDLLAQARKRLTDLRAEPPIQAREGESNVSIEARRLLRRATELAIQREIQSLEAESMSYDARRDLLPARTDLAQRRVDEATKLVEMLQIEAKVRREAEAKKAAQAAREQMQAAASQHEVLKNFADETAKLAAARAGAQGVANQIDEATRETSRARASMAGIQSKFATIQRRLDAAGLNRATGLQLRSVYNDLPEEDDLARRVRKSQDALESAEYALIDLQEQRADFGDTDKVAQQLVAQIPLDQLPESSIEEVVSVARTLVTARRDLLDLLVADASDYFDAAVELSAALHEQQAAADRYRLFIEERIFWVRSIAGDRSLRMTEVRETIAWLLSPSAWVQSVRAVGADALENWVAYSVTLVIVAMIWLPQVRLRRRLRHLGEMVSRYNTDAFVHTLEAFLWTFVTAVPIPATLWAVGWALAHPLDQTQVAGNVASGLQSGAALLYPLAVLRQTLRTRGLAEAHFRWTSGAIASLKRHLRWLMPLIVTIQILVATIESAGVDTYSASVGRMAFTVGLLALAAFLRRVLRPHGPVLKRFIEDNSGGLIARLRLVWYPLTFLLPIVFAALSWMGFHYTAMQLETKLEHSLILALVLVILNGVMLRWLFIARRRVAVEDARRKRELAATEAQAKRESGGEPQAEAPPIDEDKVDLPALSQQTRQLFRAASTVTVVLGLYIIWAQALPALRMLDRVQLFPEIRITDGATTNVTQLEPQSPPTPTSEEAASPSTGILPGLTSQVSQSDGGSKQVDLLPGMSITLADLGLGIVVLIATWAAFRNVPGLVEIVVLQRLPLDAGSRYALSTVMRYLIATIGVLIAAGTIGLAWSNVQWLAAALTFGLAFGLQEIFANFVSGLIILAERPVRLGDTVTVGGVTGTVTRIRMRATTVSDWDRKELIIPNKTFITSDVINWTLSDPVLRVTIPVGVSYESDVDKVEQLLMKIATDNRVVLADPKPQVLFKSFGDSTLDYELRVFIPSIEHLVSIRHELHMTVIKEFRKAGIEIAFPQRDLHVRSVDGLREIMSPRAVDAPKESDGDRPDRAT